MPTPRRLAKAHHHGGFSLIELLIALVIGGVILASVSALVVTQIRASATQVRIQRLRSDWRRTKDFITTEAAESVEISVDPDDTRPCDLEGGNHLFTLQVPVYRPGFGGDDLSVTATIYYTKQVDGVTQLMRCGPAINNDGTLDPTRRLGRDLIGSPTPGRLLLDGIDIDTPATIIPFEPGGLKGNTLTIIPSNPIENGVTPFTVRAKAQNNRN